ncbi:hypothetical protein [Cellulomonas sp. URHD0024]|uniref:hypothetical protein n=1 Tax=Cellulomonas sp. URHD0024 TaxID=1302620 RepID=UPI00042922CF|nr:hypothetical protein [Cellulomonas sp. URHD0024]
MYETRPAMVLGPGLRDGMARAILVLLGVFCLAWFVGSAYFLAVELTTGRHGVGEHWGIRFPTWIAFAVSLPLSLMIAADCFQKFQQAGRHRGILDYVDEPMGLRLVHNRLWRRRQTLLVERGERLEIAATLTYSRRGGLEREYRYVVTAPGGSFRFVRGGWIEKFSLAPLDAAARLLSITVVTTGAAQAIQRGSEVNTG